MSLLSTVPAEGARARGWNATFGAKDTSEVRVRHSSRLCVCLLIAEKSQLQIKANSFMDLLWIKYVDDLSVLSVLNVHIYRRKLNVKHLE